MDLIINFTPAGMIPTKDMTPHVPITTEEIVKDVRGNVINFETYTLQEHFKMIGYNEKKI